MILLPEIEQGSFDTYEFAFEKPWVTNRIPQGHNGSKGFDCAKCANKCVLTTHNYTY